LIPSDGVRGVSEKRNSREVAEHAGIACSGAVLAGGESRRFGQDKAHAILAGKPLVSHVVETLQALFEDVLIVTNEPVSYEHFDVTVVSDIVRGAGSLGGLLTALVHAKAERCFVVACDMPFLNPTLIRRMLGRCQGFDVVVPDLKGELQPLHAIYSKRCIGHIQERIAEGEFRIFDFYPEVLTFHLEERVCREVDPENRSFANINTQEELTRARRWIEGLEQKNDDGSG
jgi:molybdopterin-guanine dinucleotide biosynthesis protein A